VFNADRISKAAYVNTKHLFADNLTVAVAAEKIAKAAGVKASDEVFIAGLLHDVGVLYFINHYPDQYQKIALKKVRASSVLAAEREVFGTDHCEVGYHLSIRWRLPVAICESIRDHHNCSTLVPGASTPNIIRLASLLGHASADDYGWDPVERMTRTNQLAQALNIAKDDIEQISVTLMTDALAAAEFLDTDIGSVEDLLMRANKEIWRTYLIVHNLFQERQELSQKLLKEERERGAIESKNIAIATLSHYVNNAAMAMYGRTQLLRQRLNRGDTARVLETLPASLDVIENAVRKTVAVIAEIKDISPIDDVEFYNMSQAMKLDDRIARRVKQLSEESGLVLPEDAVIEDTPPR
jgi:hypothetical protein